MALWLPHKEQDICLQHIVVLERGPALNFGWIIFQGVKLSMEISHCYVTENTVYDMEHPEVEGKLNTNTSVPLRAIFLLERVRDGEDNSITELQFSEAFPVLYRQTFRPDLPKARRKTLHLLLALSSKVKIYRLRCALTPEAVLTAWEAAHT